MDACCWAATDILEKKKPYDCYVVAVMKGEQLVGHIARSVSQVVSCFLARDGRKVTVDFSLLFAVKFCMRVSNECGLSLLTKTHGKCSSSQLLQLP